MTDTNRRDFLKTAALATAAGAVAGCVRNNKDKGGVQSSSRVVLRLPAAIGHRSRATLRRLGSFASF